MGVNRGSDFESEVGFPVWDLKPEVCQYRRISNNKFNKALPIEVIEVLSSNV